MTNREPADELRTLLKDLPPFTTTSDDGKAWRISGDGWIMQPVGRVTIAMARALCAALTFVRDQGADLRDLIIAAYDDQHSLILCESVIDKQRLEIEWMRYYLGELAAADGGSDNVKDAATFAARVRSVALKGLGPWRPTHRHRKRDNTYRRVRDGLFQNSGPGRHLDGMQITVYEREDGMTFARPREEFDDPSRYEPLDDKPPAPPT